MLLPTDTGHQTGSSVLHGLQFPYDANADPDEDSVAVVNSTGYMKQRVSSIKLQ